MAKIAEIIKYEGDNKRLVLPLMVAHVAVAIKI